MSSLASALQSRPAPPAVEAQSGRPCKIAVSGLNFFYGAKQALEDISIDIPEHLVTAFIGPSGCGKSTFLRTLNRMNDIIPGTRVDGQIRIDGLQMGEGRGRIIAVGGPARTLRLHSDNSSAPSSVSRRVFVRTPPGAEKPVILSLADTTR